jgi:RNA polymerase sigma factor (sigma-70 family)
MSAVKEGRLEMLAVLFERHHVRLFNFFLRLTRDRERSEDLVQELFVRVLKYRHTFRADGSFTAWMYQIARHVHLSHLRRLRPELPLDEILDRQPDFRSAPPGWSGRRTKTTCGRPWGAALAQRELLLSRATGPEVRTWRPCSSAAWGRSR